MAGILVHGLQAPCTICIIILVIIIQFHAVTSSTDEENFSFVNENRIMISTSTIQDARRGYPSNANPVWVFKTLDKRHVHFAFDKFHFKKFHLLEIGDGIRVGEETRLAIFKGHDLPSNVTSITNAAWIKIHFLQTQETAPELRMTVMSIEHPVLTLTAPLEIASPNFPSNYPNNAYRFWHFQAEIGWVIALTPLHIDTELDIDYIYITAKRGACFTSQGPAAWQTWSGNQRLLQGDLYPGGPSIRIVFTSDGSESRKGFEFRLEAVKSQSSGDSDFEGVHCVEDITTALAKEPTTNGRSGENQHVDHGKQKPVTRKDKLSAGKKVFVSGVVILILLVPVLPFLHFIHQHNTMPILPSLCFMYPQVLYNKKRSRPLPIPPSSQTNIKAYCHGNSTPGNAASKRLTFMLYEAVPEPHVHGAEGVSSTCDTTAGGIPSTQDKNLYIPTANDRASGMYACIPDAVDLNSSSIPGQKAISDGTVEKSHERMQVRHPCDMICGQEAHYGNARIATQTSQILGSMSARNALRQKNASSHATKMEDDSYESLTDRSGEAPDIEGINTIQAIATVHNAYTD